MLHFLVFFCFFLLLLLLFFCCCFLFVLFFNMVIKYDLSCINVCKVPREMLKTEAEDRNFQHLPSDLAKVNALENDI